MENRRNRESQRLFCCDYTDLKKGIDDGQITGDRKNIIQDKLKEIQDLIPLKLSEAEPKKSGK